MSKDSFFQPNKSILDQFIDTLKEHYQSTPPTHPQLKRYIYQVLLDGFQNESFEFLAAFFKSKVPAQKHRKTEWSEESWSDFHQEVKNTNIQDVKNAEVFRLGNPILGNDFLRRNNELILAAVSTSKGLDTQKTIHLSNMAGLVYFLYFSALQKGTFDKDQITSDELMGLPEKVRVKEVSKEPTTKTTEEQASLQKTTEDFFKTYPEGEYNVEFIEEDSPRDNPNYAVSRFRITKNSLIHYYQLLTNCKITSTEYQVGDSSNNKSFHLYEKDSDWGYHISFPRPAHKESDKNFWVFYDGITERPQERMVGIAIVRRIYETSDPLLPRRMRSRLDKKSLRIAHDMEAVTQVFNSLGKKDDPEKVYAELFSNAPVISESTEKTLVKVMKALEEKGPPIQVSDKDKLLFD